MTRRVWLAAIVFVIGLGRPIAAHPVPFSYLDIHIEPGGLDTSLVVHIFDLAHDLQMKQADELLDPHVIEARAGEVRALLAPRLELTANGRPVTPEWLGYDVLRERQSIRLHVRYPTTSTAGVVALHTVMFPYDPAHQTFVNMYEGETLRSQMILDANHANLEYFAGSRQGVVAVIRKFVPAGIHHILIGPDHLLFLVGLLLLGGTLRQLLFVVTAFTVAHSITLSLAALNIVSPPPRLIEPAIALSIVYVGADNLLAQGGRDVRAWIAFAFGFIHGFGFANVLREMDLPARALGWSLFSFNLGVEIGQALVVVVVASSLAALRARNPWAGQRLAVAGSIVVIIAGAFWFVQRVFFPGGIS
jgi:hydrogenase/urease accessory protein HupE